MEGEDGIPIHAAFVGNVTRTSVFDLVVRLFNAGSFVPAFVCLVVLMSAGPRFAAQQRLRPYRRKLVAVLPMFSVEVLVNEIVCFSSHELPPSGQAWRWHRRMPRSPTLRVDMRGCLPHQMFGEFPTRQLLPRQSCCGRATDDNLQARQLGGAGFLQLRTRSPRAAYGRLGITHIQRGTRSDAELGMPTTPCRLQAASRVVLLSCVPFCRLILTAGVRFHSQIAPLPVRQGSHGT